MNILQFKAKPQSNMNGYSAVRPTRPGKYFFKGYYQRSDSSSAPTVYVIDKIMIVTVIEQDGFLYVGGHLKYPAPIADYNGDWMMVG